MGRVLSGWWKNMEFRCTNRAYVGWQKAAFHECSATMSCLCVCTDQCRHDHSCRQHSHTFQRVLLNFWLPLPFVLSKHSHTVQTAKESLSRCHEDAQDICVVAVLTTTVDLFGKDSIQTHGKLSWQVFPSTSSRRTGSRVRKFNGRGIAKTVQELYTLRRASWWMHRSLWQGTGHESSRFRPGRRTHTELPPSVRSSQAWVNLTPRSVWFRSQSFSDCEAGTQVQRGTSSSSARQRKLVAAQEQRLLMLRSHL